MNAETAVLQAAIEELIDRSRLAADSLEDIGSYTQADALREICSTTEEALKAGLPSAAPASATPATAAPAPPLTIVGVALYRSGLTLSRPRPDRHHHVLRMVTDLLGQKLRSDEFEQGFLTSDGRFARRPVAKQIAFASGQCTPETLKRPGVFTSEELWDSKVLPIPREYFCHDCCELRLDAKGVEACGNCASSNIEFGEINSPNLTTLRRLVEKARE